VGVDEGAGDIGQALDDVAAQFRWNGGHTEVQALTCKGRPVATMLSSVAEAWGVDLIVMGAYGHSRMREVIFGGCTQSVIEHADHPVLLAH